MNTKFFALFLLIMPFLCLAQKSSSVDMSASADYSYRTLLAQSDAPSAKIVKTTRDNGETGKTNWTAGFMYNRRLNQRLVLKTGIRLVNMGYAFNHTDLKWPSEHDGNGNWVLDPSLPHEIKINYNFVFMEFPIVARLELKQKKLSPYFEMGFATSFYLKHTVKQSLENALGITNTWNDEKYLNKANLNGLLAIGLNYDINDKFQCYAQPVFRHQHISLVNTPVREYLFNFGLEFGMRTMLN